MKQMNQARFCKWAVTAHGFLQVRIRKARYAGPAVLRG